MLVYSDWIGLDWNLPGEAFSHDATLPGTQDTHVHVQITHNTVNQFCESVKSVCKSVSLAVYFNLKFTHVLNMLQ